MCFESDWCFVVLFQVAVVRGRVAGGSLDRTEDAEDDDADDDDDDEEDDDPEGEEDDDDDEEEEDDEEEPDGDSRDRLLWCRRLLWWRCLCRRAGVSVPSCAAAASGTGDDLRPWCRCLWWWWCLPCLPCR